MRRQCVLVCVLLSSASITRATCVSRLMRYAMSWPSPEVRITSCNPLRFDCTLGIYSIINQCTDASRMFFIYVPLAQLNHYMCLMENNRIQNAESRKENKIIS